MCPDINGINVSIEPGIGAPEIHDAPKIYPLSDKVEECPGLSYILNDMLDRAKSLEEEGFHVDLKIFELYCVCEIGTCAHDFSIVVNVHSDGYVEKHVVYSDNHVDHEEMGRVERMLGTTIIVDVRHTENCYYAVALFAAETPVDAEYTAVYSEDPFGEIPCGKFEYLFTIKVNYTIDDKNIIGIEGTLK